MIKLTKDRLKIEVFDTRREMGAQAAEEAADYINKLLEEKEEINIVFAAAPSQNDFLAALAKKDIPWERINAWHMDEYVGLGKNAPQRFGTFLFTHLFNLVPLKSIHYLYQEGATAEGMCAAYADALKVIDIDIVFMGIGENGHIAFNDPHVARFDDPEIVKIVRLDDTCRKQQVHDGCFPSIDAVPTHALTLTIPVMLRADRIFNIVPTALKANAIKNAVSGPVSEACPASVLRHHKDTTLYLDKESAQYIL